MYVHTILMHAQLCLLVLLCTYKSIMPVQRVDGCCHDCELHLAGHFVGLVELEAPLSSSEPTISPAISSAMQPGYLHGRLNGESLPCFCP